MADKPTETENNDAWKRPVQKTSPRGTGEFSESTRRQPPPEAPRISPETKTDK